MNHRLTRAHYPALRDNPQVIHFDSAAAWPLHETVIATVNTTMNRLVGTPSKASYDWALEATQRAHDCRETIATLLHAPTSTIYFTYSASKACHDLWDRVQTSDHYDHIIYSSEDHISITKLVANSHHQITSLAYTQDGTLFVPDLILDSARTIFFVSHIHHLYGRMNHIADLRTRFPQATIIVDASQSVGRGSVNVNELGCDGLFFSAQKLGALAGIGACYISDRLQRLLTLTEPSSLPLPALTSFTTAIARLQEYGLDRIELALSRLTNYFVEKTRAELPTLTFAKGPAYSRFNCSGFGIISFKIAGYSSEDIAMILNDHHINVRAADHCVDAAAVDRDVVRISLHVYNTTDEIDRLIAVLKTL